MKRRKGWDYQYPPSLSQEEICAEISIKMTIITDLSHASIRLKQAAAKIDDTGTIDRGVIAYSELIPLFQIDCTAKRTDWPVVPNLLCFPQKLRRLIPVPLDQE